MHLNSTVKKIFFYLVLTTIFFHFLKDTYNYYYFFLISIISISLTYLTYEYLFIKQKINFDYKFLLFIFISSFLYVGIVSILYSERWGHDIFDLLTSFGRLFIAPVMLILLLGLAQKSSDITNSLNLYVVLFILAFISLLLQNIVGHLTIFGEDIYDGNENTSSRYGIVGYSSIIGSVTSYGVCFYTAVFITYFNKNLSDIVKAILITCIFLGAILTTSKAAFINIFICFSILILFYKQNKYNYVLPLIFILMTAVFFSSETIKIGSLGLYVNTTGHEVTEGLKNNPIYVSIFERALNRIYYNFDAQYFTSFNDFIFGIGVFGGGGVLSTNNPGTYHNSYLDLYAMGCIYYITIIIAIFTFCLYRLFKLYFFKRDELALVLLLSNSVLFFNMFFFNGALFHPLISFPFWISLVYICKFNKIKKNIE